MEDAATAIIKPLKDLENECNIDLPRRILAEKNQAFSKLMQCIKKFPNNQEVKLQCLKNIASLVQGYPDVVTMEAFALICEGLEQVTGIPLYLKYLITICFYLRTVWKPFQ